VAAPTATWDRNGEVRLDDVVWVGYIDERSVCLYVSVYDLPGCVELNEDIFGVVDDDVLEGAALRDHDWSCCVLRDHLL
jgi:hypothetical protein